MCPALSAWMAKARPDHPLRELLEGAEPGDHPSSYRRTILAAFDDIISALEQAAPLRLGEVRGDFQKARSGDDLLIVRAEMVAGAMLAQAGVGFDFGDRRKGLPQPDLVLRKANLAIEIKARRLDGLRDLERELEAALSQARAAASVVISCRERPLVIKRDQRAAIVEQVTARVSSGHWGTIPVRLDQPWASPPALDLHLRVLDQGPTTLGSHVLVEGGWDLSGHLQDAAGVVLQVLQDEQKIAQAKTMPTILLVDAARLGMSWMPTPESWAARLGDGLAPDSDFVGVGVMIPTLDHKDAQVAITIRPNAPEQAVTDVLELARDLGLTIS